MEVTRWVYWNVWVTVDWRSSCAGSHGEREWTDVWKGADKRMLHKEQNEEFSLMDNVHRGVKVSKALEKGDALLVPQRRKGWSGL